MRGTKCNVIVVLIRWKASADDPVTTGRKKDAEQCATKNKDPRKKKKKSGR